jgi:hypothetical protein
MPRFAPSVHRTYVLVDDSLGPISDLGLVTEAGLNVRQCVDFATLRGLE